MAKQSLTGHPDRERLFLLDGMALAYRAYFSFIHRPLMNSRGENTSAMYGFVNTLLKILEDEQPEHIAVVFDTKEPTFRHVMYEPYKATRQKMPDDMSSQIVKLKELVEAFNVPSIELAGYEADDIMGTLARVAEKEGVITYLVTGDKDFMQLISPLIKMYKPGKRGDEWEILDETAVMTKFGVAPEQVIDVLGLIGDKSDNVPGVPGIGEKTAIPLVRQYGSIEGIILHAEKITPQGVRQKIIDHHDKAILSKKLVTIDVNVPLSINFHHLKARRRDDERLAALFSELEFKSLLRKLIPEAPSPLTAPPEMMDDIEFDVGKLELTDITTDKHTYHLITTPEELKKLVKTLQKAPVLAVDTETTATEALLADLIGLSFAIAPGEAWYVSIEEIVQDSIEAASVESVPAATEPKKKERKTKRALKDKDEPRDLFTSHEPGGGSSELSPSPKDNGSELTLRAPQPGLPLDLVLKQLAPILMNPAIKKVGQNIKYDMLVLAAHGIELQGVVFDTMIANYVLRPDAAHNLDALAADHLHYKMITYDELTKTGRERKSLRDIDVHKVSDYSAQDADITFRLYEHLKGKLIEQELLSLCERVEFPLIPVLANMEFTGVRLDVPFLADLSKELERELERLTGSIYTLAGETFNINSTQQLAKILFEKLKLTTVRKTKTGFSTDLWVLETLRDAHPVIGQLLEYRQLQKLKSTYIDALPSLINPKSGHVHTSFNQTIAATGRLSSSNPNLQNIPIKTDLGRSIRRAFIATNANLRILAADYSQIELRLMAHISGDEALMEAFRNHEDIHATTAQKIFGVSAAQVSREMRRKAKEVNFGIMYGIGPFGLANRLDIPQSEAKIIIGKYFERFPKVKQYIADTLEQARRDGYVCTLLGRRRYFPDINNRNQNVRGNAERQAINMPIQGTAADMIKLAMIDIHNGIREQGLEAKMLLQVHDELVFEIAARDEERIKAFVVEKMKNALSLSVPIDVDAGVGMSWFEAH